MLRVESAGTIGDGTSADVYGAICVRKLPTEALHGQSVSRNRTLDACPK